jgi:general secretion pathway protein I
MRPGFAIRDAGLGARALRSGLVRECFCESRIVNRESRRACRSRIPSRQSAGFTLIELVAAFVIFAVAFGVLLQILGGALHTTSQSADYTRAAMWAQSLLDQQGIGEDFVEGSSSGRFDDHYSWQLDIHKYEPPPVTSTVQPLTSANANGLITTPVTPLDLFELQLVVSWGAPAVRHAARFATVRAMNPPVQAGNTTPPPPPIRARQ